MANARIYQEYAEALTTGIGHARVFQDYIEALIVADSVARVYQEYAEVIINATSASEQATSNTITFSQSTRLTHDGIATNILAFTQVLSVSQTKFATSILSLSQDVLFERLSYAANTLNLSQNVNLALIVGRTLPETITFTQNVTFDHPLGQSGTSTLALTQSVVESKVSNQIVSATLPLSQVVNVSFVKEATNTITFGQVVTETLTTTTSNSLTLTQDVVEERFKLRKAFANLALTQSAIVSTVISEDVSQTLNLTQTLKHVFEEVLSNDLSFTQTIVTTATKNVRQTLILSQIVALQKVLVRPVTSTLHFTEVLSTIRLVNKRMFSNLHMTQGGRIFPIFNRSTHNNLTFGQILYKDAFSEANSAFVTLNQNVHLQHIRNLNITHNINLTQNAVKASVLNFNLSDTLTFPEYRTQQVRIGDLTEITIRNVQYSLLHPNDTRRQRQIMTLSVPQKTVVLPVPHFGDGEGITDSFNMSYAVDGTVYTTVRRTGTRVINFEWDLTYPKAEELKEFIWNHNSKAIRIDNWKGEIWIVRLLTNPIDFTDNLRPSLCESDSSVLVTLEFEGVRIH